LIKQTVSKSKPNRPAKANMVADGGNDRNGGEPKRQAAFLKKKQGKDRSKLSNNTLLKKKSGWETRSTSVRTSGIVAQSQSRR
jgi:hypothetical protein